MCIIYSSYIQHLTNKQRKTDYWKKHRWKWGTTKVGAFWVQVGSYVCSTRWSNCWLKWLQSLRREPPLLSGTMEASGGVPMENVAGCTSELKIVEVQKSCSFGCLPTWKPARCWSRVVTKFIVSRRVWIKCLHSDSVCDQTGAEWADSRKASHHWNICPRLYKNTFSG